MMNEMVSYHPVTIEKQTFSYSEQWRYKGSEKLRQPRETEGASLSEQSNNKRI